MAVKYYNLAAFYSKHKKSLHDELEKACLIDNDPDFEQYLRDFERDFAEFTGTRYAVGVHSGTAALQLSLLAAGIKKGDEVLTTANTFIATALAISNTGAKPVFVDVNPITFNIDGNDIEKKITNKTKAIIPVHLYGNPCDIGQILDIAGRHGLKIIEDCCQAHGALYKGKKAGSFGLTGCFSSYTYKLIGGFGNGGIITTNDEEIYIKLLRLRNPESDSNLALLSHRTPCYLDAIQVIFIRQRFNDIGEIIKKRRANAELYNSRLKAIDIILPKPAEDSNHVYHSYVIRTNKRDLLKKYLEDKNIETEIEYRMPIHLTDTYKEFNNVKLPYTEKLSGQILSLPINEFVKPKDIEYVCREIRNFFRIYRKL